MGRRNGRWPIQLYTDCLDMAPGSRYAADAHCNHACDITSSQQSTLFTCQRAEFALARDGARNALRASSLNRNVYTSKQNVLVHRHFHSIRVVDYGPVGGSVLVARRPSGGPSASFLPVFRTGLVSRNAMWPNAIILSRGQTSAPSR